jgi:hypothetical protein
MNPKYVEVFNRTHKMIRNDSKYKLYAYGFLDTLFMIDEITEFDLFAYAKLLDSCPGHDDEGGRSWCSYCGNVKYD